MGIDKTKLKKISPDQHFKTKERDFWQNTTIDYRFGVLESMKREVLGNEYQTAMARVVRKVKVEDKKLASLQSELEPSK